MKSPGKTLKIQTNPAEKTDFPELVGVVCGVRISVDDIKTGQYVEIINAMLSSEGLRDVVLETQEIIISEV